MDRANLVAAESHRRSFWHEISCHGQTPRGLKLVKSALRLVLGDEEKLT
jgi:hypothetical protein